MINGLEGIPGSGKSYEAVVFQVLEALKTGRKVITNLPLHVDQFVAIDPAYAPLIEVRTRTKPVIGTWDANRVDDKGTGSAFELFPEGQIPIPAPVELSVFEHVWDYYDTWRHTDGRGPLFVIDECHVPLPQVGTKKEVIEYFKLHRHFNVDVLLMTQSFRDINQPIARLTGMLIKVRKADILGRKESYIRKVHAGYRGAVISTDERKYQPQFFSLYKSHTQGSSVTEASATDVKPFIVKFNRFKYLWIAGTVVYAIYAFWPTAEKPKALVRAIPIQAEIKQHVTSIPVTESKDAKTAASNSAELPLAEPEPDLLASKGVHIVGWAKYNGQMVHAFSISSGGQRIFELQEVDLKQAGYGWKGLSECMGYLTYKKQTRAVLCDAPILSAGHQSAPVVIADGSRRSSAPTSAR